ncbi:hypothetical protein EV401DRAFT_1888650 [Pisolithus croceorrhizus]|nr:hypothetical protein EV401DRAFT_1888650 [Pisolithus croceorrhizus]
MSHTDRPAREAGERQNYSKGAFSPGGDIQGLISLYAKAEGEGAHKDKLHSSDSPGQEMTVQKSQAVQLTSELGGDIRVLQSCDEPRGGVWDWDRPLRGVVDNGEWGRWYWGVGGWDGEPSSSEEDSEASRGELLQQPQHASCDDMKW